MVSSEDVLGPNHTEKYFVSTLAGAQSALYDRHYYKGQTRYTP